MGDHELHYIVYDDAVSAWQDLSADDSPRRRRAYIRTAFAAIESLIYTLRSEALKAAETHRTLYTLGEMAMLREETYSIGSKGEVYASPKFTPVPASFRFSLNMMVRSVVPSFNLEVGVSGWEDLKLATNIRNRLVHPKSAADMVVTDAELCCVHNAVFWVNDATVHSLVQCVESLSQQVDQPTSTFVKDIQERWVLMRRERQKDA